MIKCARFGVIGWWLGTVCMLVIRACLLWGLVTKGIGVYYAFAVVEAFSLAFGMVAVFRSKKKDFGPGGLFVSFAYAVSVWLIPTIKVLRPGADLVALLSFVLSAWALFCLRSRFTFGGAAWSGLVDNGPYRFVRHPQQAARLMLLAALMVSTPHLLELLRLGAAMCLSFAVVVAEERFLSTVPEYGDYRVRVPAVVVPGFL